MYKVINVRIVSRARHEMMDKDLTKAIEINAE